MDTTESAALVPQCAVMASGVNQTSFARVNPQIGIILYFNGSIVVSS